MNGACASVVVGVAVGKEHRSDGINLHVDLRQLGDRFLIAKASVQQQLRLTTCQGAKSFFCWKLNFALVFGNSP